MTSAQDPGEILAEYRHRSEHSLGAKEQMTADAWVLEQLKCKQLEDALREICDTWQGIDDDSISSDALIARNALGYTLGRSYTPLEKAFSEASPIIDEVLVEIGSQAQRSGEVK